MRPIFEINDRVQVKNPKLATFGKTGTVVTDGNAPHNLPVTTKGYIFGVKLDDAKTTRFFKEINLKLIESEQVAEVEEKKAVPLSECLERFGGTKILTEIENFSFTDVDFSYVDFTKVRLNFSSFHNCNFEGAKIGRAFSANFTGCNMQNATIISAEDGSYVNCDMQGVVFGYSDHEDAAFEDCDMRGVTLAGRFRDSEFEGCDMKGAKIAGPAPEVLEFDFCTPYKELDLWGVGFSDDMTEGVAPFFTKTIHPYRVIMFNDHIQIGCKGFKRSSWESFKAGEIRSLDGMDATRFWNAHKRKVFTLHDAYLENLAQYNA